MSNVVRLALQAASAILAIALLALVTPAMAHLTGVFAHFVEDIDDPSASTKMLRGQLAAVTQRIAELQPEVREAQLAYDEQAEQAVRRIRFYDIYAGSALGALWAGAQDPIDVISSSELMQRRLKDDLKALATLSNAYKQLRAKEATLQRYADLLVPFREAAEARERRLANPPTGLISPFAEPYIAYRIAEDWEQLRGTTFVLYFHWAARLLTARGLENVLVPESVNGDTWLLREDYLNIQVGGSNFPFVEDARFYLRADHINFSARLVSALDRYHLLVVGQLERTGPAGFQYRIEAIFIDGMPIDPDDPDVQREIYEGRLLGFDLDSVMPAEKTMATFEQKNGAIAFRFQ